MWKWTVQEKNIPAKISGCYSYKWLGGTYSANLKTIWTDIVVIVPKINLNQNTKCSVKRKWMKLVLYLNISLWNHLDALQRRQSFKVSCLKFALVSKWDFSMWRDYFYEGARNVCTSGTFPAPPVIWVGFFFVIYLPMGLLTALQEHGWNDPTKGACFSSVELAK